MDGMDMQSKPPSFSYISNPRASYRGNWQGFEHLVGWKLADDALRIIASWDGYEPTPLLRFSGLAAKFDVADVYCKYESDRFGIGSFKALGGAYALGRILEFRKADGGQPSVAVTASDGNHGLSVAWGARRFGIRCVVYLHSRVSDGRANLIRGMDAEIVRVEGNYDDSTRAAALAAQSNGWILVPDTASSFDPVPVQVMAGYGVMLDEIIHKMTPSTTPTHIFLQGGCGGLAASIAGLVRERWPTEEQPRIIIVEPEEAACLFASAHVGAPARVRGALDTVMAGLSVGEVSAVAWPVLDRAADAFMTIPDTAAIDLMRALACGRYGDPPLAVGDSGVAGLAGFLALAADPAARRDNGIDEGSRILTIATEGPVDRATYDSIVEGYEVPKEQPA